MVMKPCVTPTHASPAWTTAGWFRLIPAAASISWVSWPVVVGSGKLGKPWFRMHWANARAAAVLARVCAGVSGDPPKGSKREHAGKARTNAGE